MESKFAWILPHTTSYAWAKKTQVNAEPAMPYPHQSQWQGGVRKATLAEANGPVLGGTRACLHVLDDLLPPVERSVVVVPVHLVAHRVALGLQLHNGVVPLDDEGPQLVIPCFSARRGQARGARGATSECPRRASITYRPATGCGGTHLNKNALTSSVTSATSSICVRSRNIASYFTSSDSTLAMPCLSRSTFHRVLASFFFSTVLVASLRLASSFFFCIHALNRQARVSTTQSQVGRARAHPAHAHTQHTRTLSTRTHPAHAPAASLACLVQVARCPGWPCPAL